jgi:hypothetical protein
LESLGESKTSLCCAAVPVGAIVLEFLGVITLVMVPNVQLSSVALHLPLRPPTNDKMTNSLVLCYPVAKLQAFYLLIDKQ